MGLVGGNKSGIGKITQFLTPNGLFSFGENHGAVLGSIVGFLSLGLFGLFSGLFGGLFGGSKRKKAANNYFDQQLTPAINSIVNQYEGQQLDFATADADLEQLRQQAADQLKALKGEGKDVLKKKVNPAIDAAEKKISGDETERSRRAGLFFGPPQFHVGGDVIAGRHSNWMTRPGELLALLRDGEKVMSPVASSRYGRELDQMQQGRFRGGSGGETHIHIHAIDAGSFKQWLAGGGAKMISDAQYRNMQEGK